MSRIIYWLNELYEKSTADGGSGVWVVEPVEMAWHGFDVTPCTLRLGLTAEPKWVVITSTTDGWTEVSECRVNDSARGRGCQHSAYIVNRASLGCQSVVPQCTGWAGGHRHWLAHRVNMDVATGSMNRDTHWSDCQPLQLSSRRLQQLVTDRCHSPPCCCIIRPSTIS